MEWSIHASAFLAEAYVAQEGLYICIQSGPKNWPPILTQLSYFSIKLEVKFKLHSAA